MTKDDVSDLGGLCAELADELDDIAVSTEGDGVAYARGGAVFARISSSTMQVRLPVDIAEAALRTPDTTVDSGDRGWIRFAPGDGAQHVNDRAAAWFQTAWRHAVDN